MRGLPSERDSPLSAVDWKRFRKRYTFVAVKLEYHANFSKGKPVSQIGFIGLGIMGRPMSRNLMKAGHQVVAYDVVPALADALWRMAPRAAQSCSDVAARAEIVITMLPDGPDVERRSSARTAYSRARGRAQSWWT